VNRGFALTIGILAMLAPAGARAQTNLDRGKSASQLFAGSCIECHKAPQSLAKGKSAATIAEFLGEHYTTGRDQAAALAAYVVSGRDTVASPGPGRKPAAGAGVATQKPPSAPPDATANANANAKPHRPSEETTTSGGSMMNPVVRPDPAAAQNKPQPATAARTRRKEPGADAPQEPAVAHAPGEAAPEAARQEPAAQEPPTSAVPTTAAAPAAAEPMPAESPATESGEAGARDNIPD
jgi:hypothetical protein